MPQLDKFTYLTQFFWSCLFLFTFYIPICNDGDGVLGISRILKLRNQLVSHRENNIRSKDPNSLEDILRKGFSTLLSRIVRQRAFEHSRMRKSYRVFNKLRKEFFLLGKHGTLIFKKSMPFLFVATVSFILYLFCLKLGSMDFFQSLLSKMGFFLGRRVLLSRGLGCEGWLLLVFFLATFGIFDRTALMNMTGGNEAGPHRDDAGPSSVRGRVDSGSDSGGWRKYLNLSSDNEEKAEAESSTGHNASQPHTTQEDPGGAYKRLLKNHAAVADLVQEIHRDLHTRVPGGFQAERLAEVLEERHGAEKMAEIRHSLKTERHQSPYFREVQTDFRILRDSGGTEKQLREEWQGRR